MKKPFFLLLIFICVSTYSQNLQDPYKDNTGITLYSSLEDDEYTGEYQIFLDKFFWNCYSGGANQFQPAAISFSIEAVSFPFIPIGELNNIHQNQERLLNTNQVTDHKEYGYIESKNEDTGEVYYKGIGWIYDDYKIYQKLYNHRNCDESIYFMCSGDYGLVSQAFYNPLDPNYEEQCNLPHTILKHTLYFHCGPTTEYPVIDEISWIYDNTRGAMKEYPFDIPDQRPPDINPPIDVVFRPTFQGQSFGDCISYFPEWLENSGYYESGASQNSGSINYFPSSEMNGKHNLCTGYPYPLYYDINNPPPPQQGGSFTSWPDLDHYTSTFVHPPPFALLDAPLLNPEGSHYAGYNNSGNPMEGIPHKYSIDDPFNLRIINPSEKIVYNPSEVTINCDLTFPCHYKFLTLHGRYPDKNEDVYHGGDFSKQYWDDIGYFDFKYDRDYPTVVNPDPDRNAENMSYYILKGSTITIEPCVIIMDAFFSGEGSGGEIIYDPQYTFGNWDYDPQTVVLTPIDWDTYNDGQTQERCNCVNTSIEGDGGKSTYNIEKKESNEFEKPYDHIAIFNSGSTNPVIQVKNVGVESSILKVFDSFGRLVKENRILSNGQAIDYSNLERGIYHVVLQINGEVVEKKNFAKM